MNVGILYPRSKAHPGITQDFMDGIKAFPGLQESGITLVSESIGYGGSEKEVYEKAEKLLVIDGVDMLVAFIGEKVLEMLHPLVQSTGKLLLVVHPGANYPYTWIPQPNIIQLTLQEAFMCWLCGLDAGKEKGGDAIVASTFYDCGYLHIARMVDGYTEAGGNIVFNYVNQQAYDDGFHINEVEVFLKDSATLPTALCLFDELPASLFYKKLNALEKAAGLDIFVSPMMLQPGALADCGSGFEFSTSGYTPWLAVADAGSSKDFCDAFRSKTKREPGLFSLLGWETGMILKQIADTESSGFADGAGIAGALQKTKLNGPRGEMQLDPKTNYFIAPFVHCRLANNSGQMTTTLQQFPAEAWETYIQMPTDGSGSGWTNTYLCY